MACILQQQYARTAPLSSAKQNRVACTGVTRAWVEGLHICILALLDVKRHVLYRIVSCNDSSGRAIENGSLGIVSQKKNSVDSNINIHDDMIPIFVG